MSSSRTDALSPAIERLLGRFATLIRRTAYKHGLADADVDELVQDVRIRLWRYLGRERKTEVPASYVYMTAKSAALDIVRRDRSGRTHGFDDVRQSDVPAAPGADPADTVEQGEIVARVGRAIDSLIDSRRPVVRMYLNGYSQREISDLLGWSEAKTRNLLYRGLADLRDRLREEGIGPEGAT